LKRLYKRNCQINIAAEKKKEKQKCGQTRVAEKTEPISLGVVASPGRKSNSNHTMVPSWRDLDLSPGVTMNLSGGEYMKDNIF